MSTKTFSETQEKVNKAFKETSDHFTKNTSLLMDSYSEQMNKGYEFYKKMTEAAKHDGKDKWEDMTKDSADFFEKAITSTSKLSKEIMEKTFSVFSEKEWSSLSKKSIDEILNIFTKQAEQSRDFGVQFLDVMEKDEVLSPENFKKQSDRFNKLINESIHDSGSTIKELIASYNGQASFTQEANKKLMNNIHQQMDSLAKAHQKFTEDLTSIIKEKQASADKNQTKKLQNGSK